MTLKGLFGESYQLMATPFNRGGEGALYGIIGVPDKVVKVYHGDRITQELERKLWYMCEHLPDKSIVQQIAWPEDVVYDQGGSFRGFVMRRLKITSGLDNGLEDIYEYPPKRNIPYNHKLIIAQNICFVIAKVHEAGYVFGDFNPRNIGVNLDSGHVAFLDTDSYHIIDGEVHTYRCKVCLDGYVAPELLKKCAPYKEDAYARAPLPTFTRETDNFALAIHIFRLLMNGFTPFNGVPKNRGISAPSPGLGNDAIKRDNYCFKPGNRPQTVLIPPLSILPERISHLLTRAFMSGRTDPARRPTAEEWYQALSSYENSLVSCSVNSTHMYRKGLRRCPWCEADDRFTKILTGAVMRVPEQKPVNLPPVVVAPPPPPPPPPDHFELRDNVQVFLYNNESRPWLFRAITEDDFNSHYSYVYSNRVLMKYKGPGGDVAIPQGVTGIGAWAFSVVPTYKRYQEESSASIQAYLTGVPAPRPTMPKIRSVVIPKGVTVIGAGAFSNSSTLRSVSIPQGVTQIGDSAFRHCSSLLDVTIPRGVTKIGEDAFSNCSSLQSITIPQGVTEIGEDAFSNCSSLQSITIPQGVTEIGENAFSDCSSLRDVTIPRGVKSIRNKLFKGCSSLRSITIPEGVTSIGNEVFRGCSSLQSVTIPQGVIKIGDSAFSGCSNLQVIVLPQGVILGEDAFKNCPNLRKRPGGELDTAFKNMSHFKFDSTCHYLFKYAGPGGDVVIPRGVNTIGKEAFRKCSTVTSVKIPPGAACIGSQAFCGCDNLQSVTVAPGVTQIFNDAFMNCPKLKSVTLPSSVKMIYGPVFPQRGKLTLHPFTIYAPTGSYAQQYAQEYGYRFRPV